MRLKSCCDAFGCKIYDVSQESRQNSGQHHFKFVISVWPGAVLRKITIEISSRLIGHAEANVVHGRYCCIRLVTTLNFFGEASNKPDSTRGFNLDPSTR